VLRSLILILASTLYASLAVSPAWSQEGGPSRVALVIGNSAYQEAPLRNPASDARAMSERLTKLGFQVITVENASREAMERAILDFASRLQSESTGLFYYAGHGIQSRGRNYLLPVDAEVDNERALRFEALDVQTVLEEMAFAGNRINIVILDACRNNPFERRFRGGARGLAAIDAAGGTLIAYATAPGSVAADGDGDNGLYTSELLAALEVPGLKAEEVFKRVRVAVSERTRGAQIPWESSSLTGDFVFHAGGSVPKRVSAASASPPLGGYEALFWETIKESENPEDFRAYLRQYPQGAFASLAQIRVSALDQKAPDNASRGVGDGRLKVALLPFDGWHGGGKLASVLETMERGISGVVESDSRLQLVYAQHLESARNHPMGDAQRYWEGAPLDKTPKREEVLAAGRALGADIVLTYFFKRNRQGAYVAAYLFDVRSGEILKRELSFEPPATGQAKILTKQLVNELFAKG
jgi:hypothetical protein